MDTSDNMNKLDHYKNKEGCIEKTEKENNRTLNLQMVKITKLTNRLYAQLKLPNISEAELQ